jgi:hypothetical protein
MQEMFNRSESERLTAFALRVQPKIKQAAAALSKVNILYSGALDRDFIEARSMNGVFNTLLAIGLANIIELIDHNIALQEKELDGYRVVMSLFAANPEVVDVRLQDLPDGPVRAWLARLRPDGDGINRDEVSRYHAMHKRMLNDLIDARDAATQALVQ